MGRLAERLDALTVRVKSPDSRILGKLFQERIDVEFVDDDAYFEYATAAELEQQLDKVLFALMEAHRNATRAAVTELTSFTFEDGPHWDACQRRFRAKRDDILAAGFSKCARVAVSSVGLADAKVEIAPKIMDDCNDAQFLRLFHEAAANMRWDWKIQLWELKKTAFDR